MVLSRPAGELSAAVVDPTKLAAIHTTTLQPGAAVLHASLHLAYSHSGR